IMLWQQNCTLISYLFSGILNGSACSTLSVMEVWMTRCGQIRYSPSACAIPFWPMTWHARFLQPLKLNCSLLTGYVPSLQMTITIGGCIEGEYGAAIAR